jgi:hypothetical protein
MRFLCAFIGAAILGRATIVFNDLSSDGAIPTSISPFGGVQVQGASFGGPNNITALAGAQFTPNQNYDLTEIDISVGGNGGPGDSNIKLELFTDVGGLPGVQFGAQSWSFAAPSFSTVTKVAVSGVTVQGGTSYWLVAFPGDANTTALWAINTLVPSFQGPHAIDNPPVQGWTLLNGPQNFFDDAFAIQGTAALPEPGTWVLVSAGIGLLGMQMRRRSMKN